MKGDENTMNNESVRERLKRYLTNEPINITKLGELIGLDTKQKKYLISRFAKGQDLNDNTLKRLSDFMTIRNY